MDKSAESNNLCKKETAAAIPLFRFFYSIERAIFIHIHYMIILNNNSTPKSILF